MTAAKGAVAMLRQTCNSRLGKEVDANVLNDLSNFLEACNQLCVINFGNNNDSLSNALNLFTATEDAPKFIYLSKQKEGFTANLSVTMIDGAFRQIDENEALSVDQNKLMPGAYFDYHYLRTAVDMVLLEEEARGNLHIRDFTSTLMSRLDFFLLNSECSFIPNRSLETFYF